MRKRTATINVIPRCIEGCDGAHLATPEKGPGNCEAVRVVGWTSHDTCQDRDAMAVSYRRAADPADDEGVLSYVNVSLDTTDGTNASFTAAEARKLGEMLLKAADWLDYYAVRDAEVVSSWFVA
ncbi:hypothetical protein ABTZ99_13435 [Actinosynnema sp. NPDC002837]